jgi:hypothetical protein
VDPLADMYGAWSPYNYVKGNPILHTDPTGRSVDGEFEKGSDGNWVKTSTKGDEIGVDFYHTDDASSGKQTTLVTDRKGNWNTINNGRKALSGESRSNETDWSTISSEFYNGTGPERSLFEGKHSANSDIQQSSTVQFQIKKFDRIGEQKGEGEQHYGPISNLLNNQVNNMQLRIMGSFTMSFYKLGERTLVMAHDAKSRTSANGHLVDSYSRSEGVPTSNGNTTQRQTTTHQTYMFFSLMTDVRNIASKY